MRKILRFPRETILPGQVSSVWCFACTSIGVMEFYAGRASSVVQADLVKFHWKLRKEKDAGMGSVMVFMKHFDCYQSGWHRDCLNDSTAFFSKMKAQIDLNRPVIVQLSYAHCGVVWGYNEIGQYLNITDPGGGPFQSPLAMRVGTPAHTLLNLVNQVNQVNQPLPANIPAPPSGFRHGVNNRTVNTVGYKVTGYLCTRPPGRAGRRQLTRRLGQGNQVNEVPYYEIPAAAPLDPAAQAAVDQEVEDLLHGEAVAAGTGAQAVINQEVDALMAYIF